MWWWRSVVLFGICLVANANGQWARDSLMAEFDLAHIHDSEPVLTRRIRQSNTNQVSSLENHSNQEQSPLICHQCRSFEDGDRCIHLPTNSSIFSDTCGPQHTACMVKRFSYTENASSPLSIWYIERNCSSKCDPGCLILGERTKLYACISCCNQHNCNIGNGAFGDFGANNRRCWHNLAAIFFCFLVTFSTTHNHL